MPGNLIDTDWHEMYDKTRDWGKVIDTQVELGIPCLYHFRHVCHFRPFSIPYFEVIPDATLRHFGRKFEEYRRKEGLRARARKRAAPAPA
jgi:hypothetical protein